MRRKSRFCILLAVVAAGAISGAMPAHATPTTPGAPRVVSIETFDSGATITWAPPSSSGGSAITGYQIATEERVVNVSAATRSAKLELSENGATYHVSIAARNARGLGVGVITPAVPRPNGYWMLDQIGDVYGFGQVSVASSLRLLGQTYVHIEPSRDGDHYWTVTDSGGVTAFNTLAFLPGSDDVTDFGPSHPLALLPGERIISLSRVHAEQPVCGCFTKIYESYWLFTSRGRVLPFGRAKSYGDLSGVALTKPIVGSISTPTGKGYYMVAADGGVFAFGDAKFHGSTGNRHLNAPVTGLVPTADNTGYWLVASDGGVFAFHAPFRGSMGGTRLNRPINGMVRFGNGYLMVASDGGVFDFSNKKFYGSLAGRSLPAPIVSIAASG